MIRKAIILVLTLGAVGMAVVGISSFFRQDTKYGLDWFYGADYFCVSSRRGVLTASVHYCPHCGFYRKHAATCKSPKPVPFAHEEPSTLHDSNFGQFRWRVLQYRSFRSYKLSVPTLVPIALLAAYPMLAFFRGP